MKVGENTTIPLVWFFSGLSVVVGVVLWISFIAWTAQANSKRLDEMEKKVDDRYELLIRISQDVAIIKNKVLKQGE